MDRQRLELQQAPVEASGCTTADGACRQAMTPARALRILLLLTSALILFGAPAWQSGWALDDQETIGENPLVAGDRPAMDAFAQDYWHHRGDAGLYRPLVTLSLRFNRTWLGSTPRGFHGVNLALHLAVVLWACVVFALLRSNTRLPWLGLTLFALHPVQSEAVIWIAGRSSSLCALLGLIPLALFLAGRRPPNFTRRWAAPWAFVGVLLPLLVKEDGLAFAALWWFLPGTCKSSRRVAVLLACVCMAVLRTWALGGIGLESTQGALGFLSLAERIPLGMGILGQGVFCLLWPPMALQEIDGTGLLWQGLGLVIFVFLIGAMGRTFARRTGAFAWTTALAIALLPWLQWLPSPELFGPRYLYLPLLFAIPLLPRLPGNWPMAPRALALQLALLTALFVPLVKKQSAGFQSPEAYWVERTANRPQDARSWNGLAHAHLNDKPNTPEDNAKVREYFERSIALDPKYSRPHVGLAALARRLQQPELEMEHLSRALALAPNNAVALANMGSLLLRQKRFEEAVKAYGRATILQPGRSAARRGLARAHAGLQENKPAQNAIEQAKRLDPSDPLTQKWYKRIMK